MELFSIRIQRTFQLVSTGKEGCDGLLVGMEFVMPFFVLEDFLQA